MNKLGWAQAAGLALLTLLVGCGRTDDAPRRFNEFIGGAAPTAARAAPRKSAPDYAAYQPAAFPGGSAISGIVAGDGGDAEAQVRTFIQGFAESVAKLEIERVLDGFNPEHVAALKADISPLLETREKLELFMNVARDKFGQAQQISFDPTQLKPLLDQLLTVEVLDAQNAALKLNPDGLRSVAALAGQTAPMPPEALAQVQAFSLAIIKQEGGWKIQLPAPLTPQQANEIRMGCEIAKRALDSLTENIESGAIASLEQLPMAANAAVMGAMMGAAGEQAPANEPEEAP